MRLLEYQVGRFYKDCIYKEIEKHKCAEKGFFLGTLMFQGTEFWLNSKDCTDKDFIKEVYKENIEKHMIPETELFEILARFLCGYDKQVEYRKNYLEGEDKIEYFSKFQTGIDSKISNEDLLEKLDYIEKCIENTQ